MTVAPRSPRAPKRPPPKRQPTLKQRAEAREAAFWQAKRAHAEAPSITTLAALEKARAARGGHLTEDDTEDRERLAIELLVNSSTSDAVAKFADLTGISRRAARDWMLKALESRRLSVVAHRDIAVQRLEGIAALATDAGDFNAAGRAAAQAAKFAGVAETMDVNHRVTGDIELHHEAEALFAPLAAYPKLFTATTLIGRPLSPNDIRDLVANRVRYERAIDAAVEAFEAALHAVTVPPALCLPAGPRDSTRDERRAQIVADYEARLADLRRQHSAAPIPNIEGALEALLLERNQALRALNEEPTTERSSP
jgi:hypothetical protein